ncbi:MAG: hypothetical protein IT384_14655 [Deltaproteobacteria bacterium]|nr:hypothetical protein [Deltaproteobacteria bacterium]
MANAPDRGDLRALAWRAALCSALAASCTPAPLDIVLPELGRAQSLLLALRPEGRDARIVARPIEGMASLGLAIDGDTVVAMELGLYPRTLDDLGLAPGVVRGERTEHEHPLPPGGRFFTAEHSEAGAPAWEVAKRAPAVLDSIRLPTVCPSLQPVTVRFGPIVGPHEETAEVRSVAAVDRDRSLVTLDSGAIYEVSRGGEARLLGTATGTVPPQVLRLGDGRLLLISAEGEMRWFDPANLGPPLPPPDPNLTAPRQLQRLSGSGPGAPSEAFAVDRSGSAHRFAGDRWEAIPVPTTQNVTWLGPALGAFFRESSFSIYRGGEITTHAAPTQPEGLVLYTIGGSERLGVLLGGEVGPEPLIERAYHHFDLETAVLTALPRVAGLAWTPKVTAPLSGGLIIGGDEDYVFYRDGFCNSVRPGPYRLDHFSLFDAQHIVLAGSLVFGSGGPHNQVLWLDGP